MLALLLLLATAAAAPTTRPVDARPLPWLQENAAQEPASTQTTPQKSAVPNAPRGEIVERVVATVDRQTVTLIDVKRAAAIEIAKQAGAAVFMRTWPPGLLDEIRKHLVQRMLLLEEARRYSQPDPSTADVDTALKAFRARFPDDRAFARFLERATLTVDALKDDLRRALRVDRFLEYRIRARIELKEGEAALFQQEHPELGGAPEELVLRRLRDEIFVKRTFEYLRELLERSDVRLIGELKEVAFSGNLDP